MNWKQAAWITLWVCVFTAFLTWFSALVNKCSLIDAFSVVLLMYSFIGAVLFCLIGIPFIYNWLGSK